MRKVVFTIILALALAPLLAAQSFDFGKIMKKADDYTVALNITIEVSFGVESTDIKFRGIGTIVTEDGLIVFDGSTIDSDDPFSQVAGLNVDAEPKNIEIKKMDGKIYTGEFIGIDRFTHLGFCRIQSDTKSKFDYLTFKSRKALNMGDWTAVFALLPDYVKPSLAGDIGMVSAIVSEPEKFVLMVGYNDLEIGSVLYDSTGEAIGILGRLQNPANAGLSPAQMMESFSRVEDFMPLLGLIGTDKLNKLIADPPTKGKVDRGWLGIYLQALTPDIAEFWGLKLSGGIIINEVVKDSPADSAGLTTGDIIVKLIGEDIMVDREENLALFQRKISESGAGTKVDFTILRREDGKVDTLDVKTTLASSPLTPSEAPEYGDDNFNIKIRDMVFADYNIYNLDRQTFKGVVVKEVESGSWAEVGGMQPNDIIQSIGSQKVGNVEEARAQLEKIAEEKPKEVVFFVWRDSKTLFINVKTHWQ